MHLYFNLQLPIYRHLYRFSLLEERLKHSGIGPLQFPSLGERKHGVLPRHDVQQRKRAVTVALVAAE